MMLALAWKGMMNPRDDFPTWQKGATRLGLRILIVVGLAYIIHRALMWVSAQTSMLDNEHLMLGALALILLAYAALIAVPFVPGIEIGIGLLILQGASVAPFVYFATVLGLGAAFLAGYLTPYGWLHALLRDLRWRKACDLVERLEPMDRAARVEHLTKRLPERVQGVVHAGRYVLLAVLFNLPGNAVLGGGGGIAFIAGFSRLYRTPLTLATIAVAVLPVPLLVWLAGADILL